MLQNLQRLALFSAMLMSIHACGLKTAQQVGLRFSTEKSKLPDTLQWQEIGFAKELINPKEMVVIISGGPNPVPLAEWDDFQPSLPYKKNIDRNLLFQKTALYRSPGTPADCEQADCITLRTYKGHTWVELAKPVCIDFIGGKTNVLKPEKGKLVVKTIQKCQAILYEGSIFQLTDNQGNSYVMHATETGKPDTTAVLPTGWTLKKVMLDEPLIVSPFGSGDDCYFNIVGDHLGQGYHQYVFADPFYPARDR